tara:strand:- start:32832 stop:33221 length:390 start_codon:yes stop_codon:yes gene_type:complete
MSDDDLNMTDDEFSILKDALQDNIKDYIQLDNEINVLKAHIKDKSAKRKEISSKIMESMEKIDIDHINVKEGRLVYKVTNGFKTISKKTITNSLKKIFNDDEKFQEALKTILSTREEKETKSISFKPNK